MSKCVAAVPAYVGDHFKDAPPGHRFELYFSVWDQESGWHLAEKQKNEALKKTLPISQSIRKLLNALCDRQESVFQSLAEANRLHFKAVSISPFATGMGIEHPLENGFSFLKPYGLPYLSGSGIKGVLRKAAEELCDKLYGEGNKNWTQDAIHILFGREVEDKDTETERTRGALTFWDVLPEPFENTLAMEIMTPHYSAYYQEKQTPHDAGQPNPIVFLVVPAGSVFSFHVTCDAKRLGTPPLDWKPLLQAAFEHAFTWLGFGAKTAVGYGAMQMAGRSIEQETQLEPGASRALQGSVGLSSLLELWENPDLFWNKGSQELFATKKGTNEKAFSRGDDAKNILQQLPDQVRERLNKGKPVKDSQASLEVKITGRMKAILGLKTG